MTTPGRYLHYKGNLYRVLFVAQWWDPTDTLIADTPIHVVSSTYGVGLVKRATAHTHAFMTALWSGNTGDILYKDDVVIYVSLSDQGRVSARTVKEFEERVLSEATRPLRFERIGD